MNQIDKELNSFRVFRDNEKICIHRSDDMPEYIATPHRHDFVELTYIISGSCTHISGRSNCTLQKGDLVIVNSGTTHMNIPIDPDKESFLAYDCIFVPEFIDTKLIGSQDFYDLNSSFIFRSLFPDKMNSMPDIQLLNANNSLFRDLFSRMYAEYTSKQKGRIELIRAYLIEIFINFFRELDLRYQADHTYEYLRADSIELAITYLRNHYNANITLEEIALKSFLSKSSFCRHFKEVTGTSYKKYLQLIRIEEAKKMLLATSLSISEVSQQCGFNDIKFFYTIFNRLVGMTPGELRKKHQ